MRKWSVIALMSLTWSSLNHADPKSAETKPLAQAEANETPSCVEVEVNGQRTRSFDCLTQKLLPTTASAQKPSSSSVASETIVERPSNQLGLFNRSATSQRMGNTFGTSVYPQRPVAQKPASPLIRPAQP